MVSYTFNFKDSNEESLLVMILRKESKHIKISTGIKAPRNTFSMARQRFTSKNELSTQLNDILIRLEKKAQEAIIFAEQYNYTLEEIKSKITGKESVVGIKNRDSFLKYFLKWCTVSNTRKVATRHHLYSYNLFKEFTNGKDIAFKDMNYALSEQYIEWMSDRGLSTNTRGTQIKNVKAALSQAYKEGIHDNQDFRRFRKESEEVDNIYLSEEDLRKLESVELGNHESRVRDLFLVGCYTALRYSDYSTITADDIRGNFLYNTNKKTNIRVIVPLKPQVREIVERYGGSVPQMSMVKFNESIKEVCRKAGIDDTIVMTKAGKKGTFEKWQLVSSHTARRTAATNMYLNGIPVLAIMKITGHRTMQSFMKYIKVSLEENARMMAENPFFS